MELINQHTKKIMEGCKERAKDAGLKFQDETLEYIVTNRDLLELTPKNMIPTMYDYWVHDVEVLKEIGKYDLYPSNPYETVINTRPPISFYNDNNPDWLNVMIFYHVIGHIDFFQNNLYFRHTWDYDFNARALSDKRMINRFRSKYGIQVDYIIEFARSIDNLVGYFSDLSEKLSPPEKYFSSRLDYYFDSFLQAELKLTTNEYLKRINKYNKYLKENPKHGEDIFFAEILKEYPEFDSHFKRFQKENKKNNLDLMEYLMEYSPFLNKDCNKWMKSVLKMIRSTSIFFQPQIRTKILNEGWASYWHEKLFLQDERIIGNEISFSVVNSKVTSISRVGLNPYAIGMRLFKHIKEKSDKGQDSFEFQKITSKIERDTYNKKTGKGNELIFRVRENICDSMFIDFFLDQDFMNKYNLFVAGKRLNKVKMVWEYYVKSRKLVDYKDMIKDTLYHPPEIFIDKDRSKNSELYLKHIFEGKSLITDFIENTLIGIEYLWGGPVHLETNEVISVPSTNQQSFSLLQTQDSESKEIKWQRVIYTMRNKQIIKRNTG